MNARPQRFSDKVAIVTGGSNGIGMAVVRALLEEGASVAIADREQPAEPLQGPVLQLEGDLADEVFCRTMVGQTQQRFGRVDYLVNNAFSFIAKALEAERADWKRSLDVGPVAYAQLIQLVAPLMAQQGGGAIVNVASISAHIAQRSRWTYNAAKGAVLQLTRCAALDLGAQNIRVNSVSPGWIWTREVDKAANLDGGGRAKWSPRWGAFHMLRRVGEPVEVARPILFLLSEDAAFITGADLPVDGGYLAMGPEGLGENTVIAGTSDL